MNLPPDFQSQLFELEKKLKEQEEHEEREANFALLANKRFENNLKAFKKYYPDIYELVKNFKPRDDFCIHVTKSGEGNFVPKGKSSPLYSDTPIEQATKQVEHFLKNPKLFRTEYTKVDFLNQDERLHIQYMQKLVRLIKELGIYESPNLLSEISDSFSSCIIFGLGLGYAFQVMLEKVDFSFIYLVEPDVESFFASLFCIDWSSIIEKLDENGGSLFLLLGSTEEDISKDLNNIVENVGAFSVVNCLCFESYNDVSLKRLSKQFYDNYYKFQFGFGFYNDSITGLSHSIYNVNCNFFNSNINYDKSSDEETPVFIVGNGPSLDRSIAYLKKNQSKALIFACGTALGSLYEAGIQADFHVLVERPLRNYESLLDMIPKSEYKKLNLLAVNTVYPDTCKLYKWAGLSLKGNEAGSDLLNIKHFLETGSELPFISYSNPLVSNTALSYALSFGFSNIYLFGIDNGSLDVESIHSKFSIYSKNKQDGIKYKELELEAEFVEGNFGKKLKTNATFKVSNNQLSELIKLFNFSKVKNIGDGLQIDGTVLLAEEELLDINSILCKEKVIDKIQSKFLQRDYSLDEDLPNLKKSFERIISHLISIAEEDIHSVETAMGNMLRQSNYLLSFKNTLNRVSYNIVKGSLLYYHSPMVSILYALNCKNKNLHNFKKLNEVWISYLKAMRADFPISLTEKCQWSFKKESVALSKDGKEIPLVEVYNLSFSSVNFLYETLNSDSNFKFIAKNLSIESENIRKLVKSLIESEELKLFDNEKLLLDMNLDEGDILVFNNNITEFKKARKSIVFIRNPISMYAELKNTYCKAHNMDAEISKKIISMSKSLPKKSQHYFSLKNSALENFCFLYNQKYNVELNCLVIKYESLLDNPISEISKLYDYLGIKFSNLVVNSGNVQAEKNRNSQIRKLLSRGDETKILEKCSTIIEKYSLEI